MKIVLENCKIIISEVYDDDDRNDCCRLIDILESTLYNKIIDKKLINSEEEPKFLEGAEITYENT